ncbi:thioredoxin [Bernardetia sp. Wsw4-3y2]|uniref:thioredoxin n=1 Tax=unclassified Bernardetia TaxID=2647129 RepID=UPI0030CEE9EA
MDVKPSFQDIIQSETPVLVDFYADWCGPCQAMTPVITDFSSEMGEKVKVIKINVDTNPAVASTFNVRGIPTFIVFKNGEAVARQSGMMPLAGLRSMVDPHLVK